MLFTTCRSKHCTMFTVQQVTRGNCGMPMTAMGIWQFPLRLTCLYTCKTSNICRTAARASERPRPKCESESEIWVWAKNTLGRRSDLHTPHLTQLLNGALNGWCRGEMSVYLSYQNNTIWSYDASDVIKYELRWGITASFMMSMIGAIFHQKSQLQILPICD